MGSINNYKIAIIGLGYVGLPLAIEFSKKYSVIGFDISEERIRELNSGVDVTREADLMMLKSVIKDKKISDIGLILSNSIHTISNCNIFIVTVPTPINKFNLPDLEPLLKASASIGKFLKKGDIVIYESTVYPGCTEEDCVPILESVSGLRFNIDFFCGYSPERINPGDKVNTLTNIKKVTSGSNPEIANVVDLLYNNIITAGTFKASSIKVAEASKAIENAQRDVNISFVNELSLIFDRMGIDTHDVLEAAGTKWNFLKYTPGLVGGHCIGVDPYYLAYKSEALGYSPQVILSGRKVNDNMGVFVANKVIKLLIKNKIKIQGSNILILGFSFKENCPDFRNTKVVDVYNELMSFGANVFIFDPHVDAKLVYDEYKILLIDNLKIKFDAIILAVAHDEFKNINYKRIKKNSNSIIFDIKNFIERKFVDSRL
jgi:UDP-N-acetyl-D-galactosamine dehydrogenase